MNENKGAKEGKRDKLLTRIKIKIKKALENYKREKEKRKKEKKNKFLIVLQIIIELLGNRSKEKSHDNDDKKAETEVELENEKEEAETEKDWQEIEKLNLEELNKQIEKLKKKEYKEETIKEFYELRKRISKIKSSFDRKKLTKKLDDIEEELLIKKKSYDDAVTNVDNNTIYLDIEQTLSNQAEELVLLGTQEEVSKQMKQKKENDFSWSENTQIKQAVSDTLKVQNELKSKRMDSESNHNEPVEILNKARKQIFDNNTVKEETKKNLERNLNEAAKGNDKQIMEINIIRNNRLSDAFEKQNKEGKNPNEKNLLKIRAVNKSLVYLTAAIILLNRLNRKNSCITTAIVIGVTTSTILSIIKTKNKKRIFQRKNKKYRKIINKDNYNTEMANSVMTESMESFRKIKAELLNSIPEEWNHSIEILSLLAQFNLLESEINIAIEKLAEQRNLNNNKIFTKIR